MKLEIEANKETVDQVIKLCSEAQIYARDDVDEDMKRKLWGFQKQLKQHRED